MADLDLMFDGPAESPLWLVLAHGAGAGMDSDFMASLAQGVSSHGVRVVRFEFPYMAQRRRNGSKRPPDREPVLRKAWLNVINAVRDEAETLVIGGKSMGGRIASLIAEEAQVAGLVCLGYPFHPTGRPDQLRVAHLQTIGTPTLIVQGERDPFGHKDEVGGYTLSKSVRLEWLPDGDHSFKPRKASGHSQGEHWDRAINEVAAFVKNLGG